MINLHTFPSIVEERGFYVVEIHPQDEAPDKIAATLMTHLNRLQVPLGYHR